ncbi:MAG: amino acid-binding protein [Rhodobacteraceae bacterium]|nr:amino acid-binding protein [Paracoccaceae bacterium]
MRKLMAVIALTLSFTGVSKAADIVIGTPNWPSVQITGHILKTIIEENIGLDVEIQTSTNPIVFEAMDKGAMHAHPEVWIPNQQNLHDTFVVENGTVARNENGVAAFQGICVHQSVADQGVTSIFDLSDPTIAEMFDTNGDGRGEVWIGASGWASTNVERIKAKSYGYDQTMELLEMDETLAYAGLDNAIEQGQPWVGFCYTPHYLFAKHDMFPLEEPPFDAAQWNVIQPTDDPAWLEKSSAPVAWDLAYLHLYYAKSVETDYPEVATLFKGMKLDTETVSEMTRAVVVEGRDNEEFAQEWVAQNQDLIIEWLTN